MDLIKIQSKIEENKMFDLSQSNANINSYANTEWNVKIEI